MLDAFTSLMQRGGPVMWPLLAASVVGLTLCVERLWVFVRLSGGRSRQRVAQLAVALRAGDAPAVRKRVTNDAFGRLAGALLDTPRLTEASALQAVDEQRVALERFLPLLSTIITGAPMLGILGTVLGIIRAFQQMAATDPDMAMVGAAIGEALLTTAAGIVIALVVLLPYNSLRANLDRVTAQLEHLAAAALDGLAERPAAETRSTSPDA
jgi:biopolymer transport protein ExbB